MSVAPLEANPTDYWHLGVLSDLRERPVRLATVPGIVPAGAVLGVHKARRPGRLVAFELHREKAGSVASTMDIDVTVNGVSVIGADDKLQVSQADGDDQHLVRQPKGAAGWTENGGLVLNPGDVLKAHVLDNENGDAEGLFLDAIIVY